MDALLSLYETRQEHCPPKVGSGDLLPSIETPVLALRDDSLLVDLRTTGDFARWHLPCAINIGLVSFSSLTQSPFSDPSTLERQWRELEALFQLDKDGGTSKQITDNDVGFALDSLHGKLVILLCYDGDTARVATSVLRPRGTEAYSIRYGVQALLREWSGFIEDDEHSDEHRVDLWLAKMIAQARQMQAVA